MEYGEIVKIKWQEKKWAEEFPYGNQMTDLKNAQSVIIIGYSYEMSNFAWQIVTFQSVTYFGISS